MGLRISLPINRVGLTTLLDDDGNDMLIAHAYLCNQDGMVEVVYTEGASASLWIKAYDDDNSDPPTAGDLRAGYLTNAYGQVGSWHSLNFLMRKGRYFEIVVSVVTAVIRWVPFDSNSLIPCTDYD